MNLTPTLWCPHLSSLSHWPCSWNRPETSPDLTFALTLTLTCYPYRDPYPELTYIPNLDPHSHPCSAPGCDLLCDLSFMQTLGKTLTFNLTLTLSSTWPWLSSWSWACIKFWNWPYSIHDPHINPFNDHPSSWLWHHLDTVFDFAIHQKLPWNWPLSWP